MIVFWPMQYSQKLCMPLPGLAPKTREILYILSLPSSIILVTEN